MKQKVQNLRNHLVKLLYMSQRQGKNITEVLAVL